MSNQHLLHPSKVWFYYSKTTLFIVLHFPRQNPKKTPRDLPKATKRLPNDLPNPTRDPKSLPKWTPKRIQNPKKSILGATWCHKVPQGASKTRKSDPRSCPDTQKGAQRPSKTPQKSPQKPPRVQKRPPKSFNKQLPSSCHNVPDKNCLGAGGRGR